MCTSASCNRTGGRAAAVLAASLALILLVAAGQPAAPGPLREVRVAIGPPAVVGYLPVYVAMGLGAFDELARTSGLRTVFIDFRGGPDATTALIGGDVQFATVTITQVIKAHEQGKDLKFLLTFFNAQTMAMIVQAELREVTAPSQLRGRRVGVTSLGSATHMQARHILAAYGVEPEAVQFVPVGGPQTALAAWRRKTVDALVYLDPLITTLVEEGSARLLYDVRTLDGTVRLYGAAHISSGLLTRPEVIARDPDAVQALVDVFVRTLRWLRAHRTKPEEIARVLPAGLNWTPAMLRANLAGLSPDGRVLPEAVGTVIRFLKQDRLLDPAFAVPVDRLVDDRFVRKAIAGGGGP
ncbi:MAG: ABC transporter substrate-binding protein [Armatimonadota bacterium]|nr:ABC transporter substrate-binding protein [Armatimonadota bacterium]